MTRARDLGDFIADGAAAELVVDTTTLVVDSTNNRVGIGTASPSQALDVNGTGNFTAVTAGTITIDDITINGSTISDGGDFTLDVGGNIVLDADGGGVYFKDAGTTVGFFQNDGGDFRMVSSASDKDIKFLGNDGGSTITALTLDMSNAGAATFNAGANFGGAVDVTGNVTVSGTVDGIDIAGNINQAVKTTSSPHFANLYIEDKLYHYADSNTYLQFGTDAAYLYTGGTYIQFTSGGIIVTDGSVAEDYDALSGTTPTCDVTTGGMFSLTTSGNTTFTFSGAASGYVQGFTLQLTAGGTHTITYPNSVDFAGGSAPDAPASGETDILVFITRDGGTTWYGALAIDAAG